MKSMKEDSARVKDEMDALQRESSDFSLILGGPLFQLLRRAYLTGTALELLRRRMIAISLFCWLPLLILALVEGNAFGGASAISFVMDIDVHSRFLVALPILIAAELIVHQRIRIIVQQFISRDLLPPESVKPFLAAIHAARRLRNSVVVEVVLVALVFVAFSALWKRFATIMAATWYGQPAEGGLALHWSGYWLAYVSVPAFQFILLRWYFRIFIWVRFLWQVSRLKLNLYPTHLDRRGGLGFLGQSVHAFASLALAHGVLLSGTIANHIFYAGASLLDYKAEIIGLVALLGIVILGPLLVFSPKLYSLRLTGQREYGALAQRYVSCFHAKWIEGGAEPDEAMVSSPDFSALTDLGIGASVVMETKLFVFSKDAPLQVAVAALVPIAPLALTMMSVDEILKKLLAILF